MSGHSTPSRLNRRSRPLARRTLLRGVGWGALGASAAALLAACGDPELPEPPALAGRASSPAIRPVTSVVAVQERTAQPQAAAPVTIGIPTGNPLFDPVALRIAGLAADSAQADDAPADLRIVQFEQALTFDSQEMVTAVEAMLPNHPQLDALLVLSPEIALTLAERGHAAPVNGPAASASGFSADDFLPSAVGELTTDGNLFGLPLWVSVSMVRYTPSHLADAGVDPEALRDWDWELYRETARRLTRVDADGHPQRWGAFAPPGLMPSHQWIWQNGGSVANLDARQATLDTTAALEAVEFLHNLALDDISPRLEPDSPGVSISTSTDSAEMLVEGAPVAMLGAPVGGLFGGLFGNELNAGGLLAPPRRQQAASDSTVFGVLSLLSTSDHPDAAFRTLDWIADRIAPVATVPARGASAAQLQLQGGYSAADAGAVMQAVNGARSLHGPYAPGIRTTMAHHVDLPIASGQADPAAALAAAHQAVDELLRQSPAEALTHTHTGEPSQSGSSQRSS